MKAQPWENQFPFGLYILTLLHWFVGALRSQAGQTAVFNFNFEIQRALDPDSFVFKGPWRQVVLRRAVYNFSFEIRRALDPDSFIFKGPWRQLVLPDLKHHCSLSFKSDPFILSPWYTWQPATTPCDQRKFLIQKRFGLYSYRASLERPKQLRTITDTGYIRISPFEISAIPIWVWSWKWIGEHCVDNLGKEKEREKDKLCRGRVFRGHHSSRGESLPYWFWWIHCHVSLAFPENPFHLLVSFLSLFFTWFVWKLNLWWGLCLGWPLIQLATKHEAITLSFWIGTF